MRCHFDGSLMDENISISIQVFTFHSLRCIAEISLFLVSEVGEVPSQLGAINSYPTLSSIDLNADLIAAFTTIRDSTLNSISVTQNFTKLVNSNVVR